MSAHNDFLDECMKECLLTDLNLFKILTKLNQNNSFFARVIQRQFGAFEQNDFVDPYQNSYEKKDEEDMKTVDPLAIRRRKERINKKSEQMKHAF